MTKKISFNFWTLVLGLVLAGCTPDAMPDNIDMYLYFSSMPPATHIVNPYEGIDLTQVKRLKANLHTHTRVSDGKQTADEMIKAYAERGYDILAITDHDQLYAKNTGFVQVGGKDILVIRGSEFTMTHHFNSIFTNNGKSYNLTVESAIRSEVNNSNSVLFFNHPGRHNWFYPVSFYFDMFGKFPVENLVGMEVVNSQDEYPSDKETWHKVLTAMSPSRPVYGFANDDSHSYAEIGFSFNEFLTDDFTEEGVRRAIVNGVSFFSSTATVPRPSGPMPHVKDIVVDTHAMTITVDAINYDKIEWRSCGIVVGSNEEIAINNDGYNFCKYVQFTLIGKGGQLFSQPFLIK